MEKTNIVAVQSPIFSEGFRFSYVINEVEVARARLYVLRNDLHTRPFGFIEDVFVDIRYRGQGYGSKLVRDVISSAREQDCYKLICTSRIEKPLVHELYVRHGFVKHGLEFRMNL